MESKIATDADQIAFDQAYWAAQPPAVQTLQNMDVGDLRNQAAALLASYNYRIDIPIMGWGWDPYNVMKLRQSFGYTWTPSAMESPVQIAPGLPAVFIGLKPYDPKVPTPRAFKVSLDFADYPPYVGN